MVVLEDDLLHQEGRMNVLHFRYLSEAWRRTTGGEMFQWYQTLAHFYCFHSGDMCIIAPQQWQST